MPAHAWLALCLIPHALRDKPLGLLSAGQMEKLVLGAQARYAKACLEVVLFDTGGAGAGADAGAGGAGLAGGDSAAKRKRSEPSAPGSGAGGDDGAGPSKPPPGSGSGGGAASAAPAGYFTIEGETPEVRYYSCKALMDALDAPRYKTGAMVSLYGVMKGCLTLRVPVRLRGEFLLGRRAVLLGVEQEEGAGEPRHTLDVRANNCSASELQINTPIAVAGLVKGLQQAGAVFVSEGFSQFSLDDVYFAGDASKRVRKKKVNYGHSGIWMASRSSACFKRVRMVDLSGDGAELRYAATAQFDDVLIANVSGNGIWLNASKGCTFDEVHTTACGGCGYYLDALDVCTLRKCSARDSGETALVVDLPLHALEKHADAAIAPELLHDGHKAHGFIALRSGTYGVLCCRGAGVDLAGARLEDNQLNAVRTEFNARRPMGATARTKLVGAKLLRNGLSGEMEAGQEEQAAIAVERNPVTKEIYAAGMPDYVGAFILGNGYDGISFVDGKPTKDDEKESERDDSSEEDE